LASLIVAVNCVVAFTSTVEVDGVTATDATGGGADACTVTVVLPDLPSLRAVIVACPAAMPVTRPDAFTVAVPLADVSHVTARPDSSPPFAPCH
jgi:hypothetical protein